MTEQPVHVAEHWRGGGPAQGQPAPGAGVPPGDGSAPPPQGGGGFMSTRVGPLPVWGWLALGGLLAVGAVLWVRKGKAGLPQSASGGAGTAGTATSTGCYDAGGNSVPCGQADYAGQIAALQAEIENL